VSNVVPLGDKFSVRVPKTAELVASHIRRQIVLGELHEGDALPPESALLEDYSVSRPTLREAFRILESEGLITVRRGARGGARVQEPTADVAARYAGHVLQHRGTTVADVLEARVIVEAPAARMLAERRNRIAVANELQERLDSADPADPGHFHEFNARVVELTENETLILLTTMLENVSQAVAISYSSRPQPQTEEDARLARRAHRTRQKLIDLIRAGDADGAEDLWRRHLIEAGKVLAAGTGERLVDLFG
jgi:DNA-binding FadR family transcriptional regulator